MQKWLTSRTAYETGLECSWLRYYRFHHGPHGMGIERKGLLLDPWIGTQVHAILESILRLHIGGVSEPLPPKLLRPIINGILEQSKTEISADQSLSDFTKAESLALVEALSWGWIRACLPSFLQRYEIVAIELDLPYDLPQTNIRLQTRADMVLRRKADGKLIVWDWKTNGSSQVSDLYIAEFRESPQMAFGSLAAQEYLKEPVKEYAIQVLLKGYKDYFKNRKGQRTPEKRYHSPLLYAQFSSAAPPLHDTQFTLGGYWLDKQPAWEQDFSQREDGQSPMECYIYLLPMETLWEQFVEIGPYERNEFTTALFLKSLQTEESKWQHLQELLDTKEPGTVELDNLLSRNFKKCHNQYGKQCSFYNLCYKLGTEDGYTRRSPHHPQEALALREKLDSLGVKE